MSAKRAVAFHLRFGDRRLIPELKQLADSNNQPKIYIAKPVSDTAGKVLIEEPSQAWLTDYLSNVNFRTE